MSTIATTPHPAASSPLKRLISGHPLLAYFVIAFAGFWALMLPLALSRGVNGLGILPFKVPEDSIAFYIAGILFTFAGPALASLGVTAVTSGKAGVGRLLSRCVQWRVGVGWYLIAIFGYIPILLVGFSIFYGVDLPFALLLKWTLIFTVFFPQAVFSILTGNFAEELGWRGFALPRVQQRYGPVLGTVILGSLHSLWHVPVFFTAFLGPFSLPGYVSFLIVGIAATFFYTWVFNHTKGSVLIATLVHGFGNAALFVALLVPAHLAEPGWARPFVSGGWQVDTIVIYTAFAVLLLVATRGRLGYNPERNAQLIEGPRPAETSSTGAVEPTGRL